MNWAIGARYFSISIVSLVLLHTVSPASASSCPRHPPMLPLELSLQKQIMSGNCAAIPQYEAAGESERQWWRTHPQCGHLYGHAPRGMMYVGLGGGHLEPYSKYCHGGGVAAAAKEKSPPSQSSAAAAPSTSAPRDAGCPDDVGPGMLLTNPGSSVEGSSGCKNGSTANAQLQGPLHKGDLPNVQGHSQTPEVPGVSPPAPPLIADNGPGASPNPGGECAHGSVPIGRMCVPCTDFKPESPTAHSPACQSPPPPSNPANQKAAPDQKGACSQGAMFYIKNPPRTGNARTGDCMGTCYVFENSCAASAIKLTYRASTGYGNNCGVLQSREITVPAGKPGSSIDFSCSVPSIDKAEFTK